MKMLTSWVLASIFLCMSSLSVRAEGLPLPWPFPWAKECPVDWSELQGRYDLSDNVSRDRIDVKVRVATKKGLKLVHISRFSQTGVLLAEGTTVIGQDPNSAQISDQKSDQKSIKIYMVPIQPERTAQWAKIDLRYDSWDLQCTMDHLVPILTLESAASHTRQAVQYKLVKVSQE